MALFFAKEMMDYRFRYSKAMALSLNHKYESICLWNELTAARTFWTLILQKKKTCAGMSFSLDAGDLKKEEVVLNFIKRCQNLVGWGAFSREWDNSLKCLAPQLADY